MATPATWPSSVRAISASDLPPRRTDAASTSMSCTAPARQTPITSQSKPGHVAVLDRQHRTDQRPGAGDGREVMAEQHPLVGRVVVLAVVEAVRGRDPRVVEHGDPGGEEGAVIAIGDGQHCRTPSINGMAVTTRI